MPTYNEMVGERLRSIRRQRGLSLQDVQKLSDQEFKASVVGAYERGEAPWKLLFDKLGDYFDRRFGADWKKGDAPFWDDFESTFQIGRGIQERLKKDPNILDKF